MAGLKWKENEKRKSCIASFSRFDRANVCSSTWNQITGKSDALILVVNKAVLFHGVRLFGDNKGRQYKVKFTIKDKNVTGTYRSEQDNDGVSGYDVMLPNPISLLPNEENTIIATITGPESYSGCSGKSSVKIDDVVVTFKNCKSSSNGTNIASGQIYKIFLSQM